MLRLAGGRRAPRFALLEGLGGHPGGLRGQMSRRCSLGIRSCLRGPILSGGRVDAPGFQKRGDGSKGYLNIAEGALARTTFNEISVGENATLNLNRAAVTVASYKLNGVAQPEGTYGAHGGTITVDFDAMSGTPQSDRLVVDGEMDLGSEIVAVDSVSGSGFATNGTVVVTGDVIVSVGRTWSVDVPTFDRLVLGPKSRLVVKGAGNLPRDKTINILPFTTLSGRFASVVGVGGAVVNLTYEDDHVCAQCEPGGTRIMLR